MNSISQFSLLPPELKTLIFSYLSPKDLPTAMSVKKAWKELIDTQVLWMERASQLSLSDRYFQTKYVSLIDDDQNWKRVLKEFASANRDKVFLRSFMTRISSLVDLFNLEQGPDFSKGAAKIWEGHIWVVLNVLCDAKIKRNHLNFIHSHFSFLKGHEGLCPSLFKYIRVSKINLSEQTITDDKLTACKNNAQSVKSYWLIEGAKRIEKEAKRRIKKSEDMASRYPDYVLEGAIIEPSRHTFLSKLIQKAFSLIDRVCVCREILKLMAAIMTELDLKFNTDLIHLKWQIEKEVNQLTVQAIILSEKIKKGKDDYHRIEMEERLVLCSSELLSKSTNKEIKNFIVESLKYRKRLEVQNKILNCLNEVINKEIICKI